MNSLNNVSIIIPSLDPGEHLKQVVDGLSELGFTDIILVDDGSCDECKKYFPVQEGVTLLTHETNKGKGAALKTAYNYVIANRHDSLGVITCDSDGQHLPKDILKVCNAMLETGKFVLGVRNFSLDNVPFKSKFGNRFSTFALALCSGKIIHDTQTGLRAIPYELLRPMAKVEGNRFEYETNVLLELKNMNAKHYEVEIETVYLNENKGTHFHPLKDTVRILSRILKYALSSCAAFLTDIILFQIFNGFLQTGVILATVISRLISSVVNFTLNKKMVFHSDVPLITSAMKYYALAIPIMLISAFGVKGLSLLFSLDTHSVLVTVLKIVVDTLLFILNYNIQKTWIFKNKK